MNYLQFEHPFQAANGSLGCFSFQLRSKAMYVH